MTNPFETTAGGLQDYFGTGLVQQNPNQLHFRNTVDYVRPLKRREGGRLVDTGVIEWQVTYRSFDEGLYGVFGDFNAVGQRVATSTLLTNHPGLVMLPVSTGSPSSPGTWANIKGHHSYNIFGALAHGLGSAANASLYADGSARTFTPNGPITCIGGMIIGGNTSAERLVVGASSGVGEILSDLGSTPTSSGDMHADTNPMWGVIPTGLPSGAGFINLLYIGGTIAVLLTSDAIGTQPITATNMGINGGFALGMSDVLGVMRAFWVWPKQNTTAGMLVASTDTFPPSSKLGHIWHTNLEGTDPIRLDIPLKNGVFQAAYWPGKGLVYTDGREVWWYRQGGSINTGWNRERAYLTTAAFGSTVYIARGFHIYQGRLRVLVSSYGLTTQFQWEEFDDATWSWHAVSASTTFTIGAYPYPAAGAQPTSYDDEKNYIAYTDTSTDTFVRQQVSPPSLSPLFSSSTKASSGSLTTPMTIVPGLGGTLSVVEEIAYHGYLYSGWQNSAPSPTENASVTITVGTQGKDTPSTTNAVIATFNEIDRAESRQRRFPSNTDAFTYLQVTETLTKGTNAATTSPQGVPFVIRGLAFPDGKVRSPMEVRGY